MARRNAFLYNSPDPLCLVDSAYTVKEGPVLLAVMGLLAGQSIPIEVELAAPCAYTPGHANPTLKSHWTPYILNGKPVALTEFNTRLIEFIPGKYRINASAIPAGQPVVVIFEEDESFFKDHVNYNLTAPSSSFTPPAPPCDPAVPGGIVGTWG
jgi:hypothetical protein